MDMKVTVIVTPAQAGVHVCPQELDSRFRGNDRLVTFDGAKRDIWLCFLVVTHRTQSEIPRFARNDSAG
jgi:hypothetical protein